MFLSIVTDLLQQHGDMACMGVFADIRKGFLENANKLDFGN
jgi:hypothetical protein